MCKLTINYYTMQLHYTLHTYSMLYVLPNDSSITLVRILRFSLNASYKTHHAMILTTVIKIREILDFLSNTYLKYNC